MATEKYDYGDDITGVKENEEFFYNPEDFPPMSSIDVLSKTSNNSASKFLKTILQDASNADSTDADSADADSADADSADADSDERGARKAIKREAREREAREARETIKISEEEKRKALEARKAIEIIKREEEKRKEAEYAAKEKEYAFGKIKNDKYPELGWFYPGTYDFSEDSDDEYGNTNKLIQDLGFSEYDNTDYSELSTFVPSINKVQSTKYVDRKDPLYLTIGDMEIEYFPIKKITESGKLELEDKYEHYFSFGDEVTIDNLVGWSLGEIQDELIRIESTLNPMDVYNTNEEILSNLNGTPNINITVQEDQHKYFKLVLTRTMRNVIETEKGKFHFEQKLYIKSGRVYETPQFNEAFKEDTKRKKEKQQYSQSQKAAFKTMIHNQELALKLGFDGLEQFLAAKKEVENNSLFDKVWSQLEHSSQLSSIVNLDDKILNLIKDIRSKNKDVFDGLEIGELVLIIKYYLLNPDNTDNLRALYKNPIAIGLGKNASIDKLDDEPRDYTSERRGTTHGTMFFAVGVWIEERSNGNSSSSTSKQFNKGKGKSKGKGKDKGHNEKYLKYKTKYLALKAELGM